MLKNIYEKIKFLVKAFILTILVLVLPFIFPIILKILISINFFDSISEFKNLNLFSFKETICYFLLAILFIYIFSTNKNIIGDIFEWLASKFNFEFTWGEKTFKMNKTEAAEKYNEKTKFEKSDKLNSAFVSDIKREAKNILKETSNNLQDVKIRQLEDETNKLRYIAAYEILNYKFLEVFDTKNNLQLNEIYNAMIPYYIKNKRIRKKVNKTLQEEATDIVTKKINKLNNIDFIEFSDDDEIIVTPEFKKYIEYYKRRDNCE